MVWRLDEMRHLLKSQQHELVLRQYIHNGEKYPALSGSFQPYGLQHKTDRRRLQRFVDRIQRELDKHA